MLRDIRLRAVVLVTMVLSVSFRETQAQIVLHSGAANPATEGFTLNPPGNATMGSVSNDLGFDAWSIDVNGGSQFGFYARALTEQERLATATQGWILSARLRVIDSPENSLAGMVGRFYTGTSLFALGFGVDSNGNAVVGANQPFPASALTYAVNDDGYHTYDLKFDPNLGSATLSVDGIPRLTNLTGSPLAGNPRVDFGAGQTTAHANWNLFSLSVVPEPTSAMLLGLGTVLLGRSRQNRVTAK